MYRRDLADLSLGVAYCDDDLGLPHQAYQRTDSRSGGQQQRVVIARVVSVEPSCY